MQEGGVDGCHLFFITIHFPHTEFRRLIGRIVMRIIFIYTETWYFVFIYFQKENLTAVRSSMILDSRVNRMRDEYYVIPAI